ncbi:hypothetical protein BpHYR1_018595 [Brachionus plicatilis]|uniref:Uncharacterized protein n=1 Tax=Brachionus plicatilis TaxID=10195 RepID=A0A3M7Q036_BRAPC|nr:hypothetical protein BpHYR1_018595 [Brachionus plicatilis]
MFWIKCFILFVIFIIFYKNKLSNTGKHFFSSAKIIFSETKNVKQNKRKKFNYFFGLYLFFSQVGKFHFH